MSTDRTNVQDETFDVVVVGGGNGGYATALRAVELELSVALVEVGRVGGTCLNRGCVPTKALLETAHRAEGIRTAQRLGLDASLQGVDWDATLAFKTQIVDRMRNGLGGLLRGRGVTVVEGRGRLAGPGAVQVEGADATATPTATRGIVLAPGCRPRRPQALAVDGRRVLTSDEALDGPLPATVVVIGGNYIGVEFAGLYRGLGAEVTLVEQLDRIAPHEDADVSRALAQALDGRGIEVRTGTAVTAVHAGDDGVEVTLDGDDTRVVDVVLVAVGREPCADDLGLEALGVETHDGFIVVDDDYRTSADGVLAVGDAIQRRDQTGPHPQLAHVALAEGLRAAETLAGVDAVPVDYAAIPHVIYGAPEVAAVGYDEAAARAAGHEDVRSATYDLSHNARALMLGEAGFVKTVTDGAGTLLGVHAVGPHASEVLHACAMATAWSARVEEVAALVHAHPTVGEAFGETALALAGAPLHMAAPAREAVAS